MSFWPIGVYFAAVLFIVATMIVLPQLLGERHRERATGQPYESGAPPTGSGRSRISAQYYLMAVFFLVFDLEAVFLFAWAVAARQVGWAGYIEAAVFIAVLLAGLAYLWRVGALDWSPTAAQRRARPTIATPRSAPARRREA